MSIRVMVIDDVEVERRLLRGWIGAHRDLELVGEASSVDMAREEIGRLRPDVIFLDVQIGESDGFRLLRGLSWRPTVVFVSAWPHYAIDAFAVEAADYLLKPVTAARFATTVQRLVRLQEGGGTGPLDSGDQICLNSTTSSQVVPVGAMRVLVADGDFTRVLVAGKPEVLVCRRLGAFEETLPMPPFARLDRSLIVNVPYIDRLERLGRNDARLWMQGLRVPLEIGRTAMERLRSLMP
jgi:two-component system LytT family response regulator